MQPGCVSLGQKLRGNLVRYRIGVALAVLALAASAPAWAAPDDDQTARPDERQTSGLPVEGVITRPDWARLPTGEDVAKFYPSFAESFGISGRATIDCVVAPAGTLKDCVGVNETPTGFGFGDAAIGMSSVFLMKPQTLDGQAVGGGHVRIPIAFRIPEDEPIPEAPPEAQAPVSPKALELARHVAKAASSGEAIEAAVKAGTGPWREWLASNGGTREQLMMMDDMEAAVLKIMPGQLERYAQAYARVFSEKELVEIARFIDSPAGHAWASRQAQVDKLMQADRRNVVVQARDEARRMLCSQIACASFSPPPKDASKPTEAKSTGK